MKTCLVNREGGQCDFPVVAGGRCKYHQVGTAYGKDESIRMKRPVQKRKSRKDVMKFRRAGG